MGGQWGKGGKEGILRGKSKEIFNTSLLAFHNFFVVHRQECLSTSDIYFGIEFTVNAEEYIAFHLYQSRASNIRHWWIDDHPRSVRQKAEKSKNTGNPDEFRARISVYAHYSFPIFSICFDSSYLQSESYDFDSSSLQPRPYGLDMSCMTASAYGLGSSSLQPRPYGLDMSSYMT